LRLSKQTEYGLRAVVQLARIGPRHYAQSRDLSQAESGMPSKYLEAILLTLRRGGFLESKVGREGGYRLAKSPKEIRIGDLIRRLEGRLTVHEEVVAGEISPGEIAVHLLNQKLTEATDDVLDSLTLADLLDQANLAAGLQQQMYYI